MLCGGGVVAGGHRQPAQLQLRNARQLVFELARRERGLLQSGHGGGVASAGGQGRAQFHVDPGLRPVVGMPGRALQVGDDVVENLVVRGERPQQLGAAAQRKAGAADDLVRLNQKQLRRLHNAALDVLASRGKLHIPDLDHH